MSPDIGKEEEKSLIKCVRSKHISQGKFVQKFEKDFSMYLGTKYASAVCNGTAALHLALVALGINKKDEVIVPNCTFISTPNAVSYTGAKPVFVDIDETYCIDPKEIKKAITKRTKAIIAVHLYGNVADMGWIKKIARKYRLYVIEDCAEAHGAEYKGKKVGSIGDVGCFSFYGNKIITTGEGGMCVTNNKKLKKRIDFLRAQGKPKLEDLKPGREYAQMQFYHHLLAFNYRMTDLQASIGIEQLRKINKIIKRRMKIASIYEKKIKGFKKPIIKKFTNPVYWFYPILCRTEKEQIIIMNVLRKKGIILRSFFYPCNKQPFYFEKKDLRFSIEVNKKGILLPTDIEIKDAEEITYTLNKLSKR